MKNLSLLVCEAQQGNLEAFEELVRQFQDMAFTIAYIRLGDESLAKDAAQEGLIEAYLHIRSLKQAGAFAGWLRRIVLRQCSRIHRRKSVETVSIDNMLHLSGTDPDPFDLMIDQEKRHVIRRAIDELPEGERTGILLHYISGYSQQQIAEFLEVPAATIRKRLQSARGRLREKFTTMNEDYFEQKPSETDQFSQRVRFFIAVRTGNSEDVREQLKKDPDLATAIEGWSETLSHLYPRAQPSRKMRDALETRRHGWTPLYWAVVVGDMEIATLLLDHEVSIEENDWRGTSVLVAAVERQNLKMVSLLLERGANPDASRSTHGPLHTAAAVNNQEIADLLLTSGAAINHRDRFGRSPLFWAAMPGHRSMVEYLMEQGADQQVEDEKGRSALWWAKHSGYHEVAAVLEKTEQPSLHGRKHS